MRLKSLLPLIKSYTKIKIRTDDGEEYYPDYQELFNILSNCEVYEIVPDFLDKSLLINLGSYIKNSKEEE